MRRLTASAVTRLLAGGLLLLAISAVHFTAAAPDTAAVWVLDQREIKRVDLNTNQYIQTISLAQAVETLAFDAKSNVLWALASQHLLKFDANGALLTDIDLTAPVPPGDALRHLVLDPHDGGLWVGGNKKTVLHLDAQGQVLLQWAAPENIQAIGLVAFGKGFFYRLVGRLGGGRRRSPLHSLGLDARQAMFPLIGD